MKLLALDGNSLAYRAFFALPDTMATASGLVTNSIFGFCSMFANLVKDHQPDGIVVVFDRKERTFRHEAAPEYKAQREKQPDTLYQQLESIREVLAAAGVLTLDCAGFEGDDIIATIAHSLGRDDELIIVTGDRDAYQLVRDPQVRVLYNKRGVSDYAMYDEAGIRERTGVSPAQYVEYAALRGDPSDNLEGARGVGEKTAAKLITTYGSLSEVIAHAKDQTPKLRESLIEAADRVLRNAELMRLRTDVPVEAQPARLTPSPDMNALATLFNRFEFSTMLSRWRPFIDRFAENKTSLQVGRDASQVLDTSQMQETSQVQENVPENTFAIHIATEVDEVCELVSTNRHRLGLAAVWTSDVGRSPLSHIVLATESSGTKPRTLVVPISMLTHDTLRSTLRQHEGLVVHDGRNLLRSMLAIGIDLQGIAFDSAIAAYLVDAESGLYDPATVARRWLQRDLAAPPTANEGQLDFDGGYALSAQHTAIACALVALDSERVLRERLTELGMASLYDEVELPLVRVLAKMEHLGIGVDRQRLIDLESALGKVSKSCETRLYELAGKEFNVNSTQQLAQILFVERGLTAGKRTKSKKGYSTDAATLEKLQPEWPEFIDALLQYRETEKLRSTYALGLLHEIGDDDRIHASFNQTVARTGRLSSDRPNLHNIPIRSEAGKEFRTVFIPAPDWQFLVADYNQIELRCIAHLAQDPGLIAAFNAGQDIHRTTAARVFNVATDQVTSEQRSRAKMVSYGLAYGMEAYGLSQRLGVEVSEAREILDAYFAAFPRVHRFMEESVSSATKLGYTTTLFGRRRPIEGLTHPNRQIQAAAQRMAMNAAIQGLAADIFKIALVGIDRALEGANLRSRLVLQVHDEVIVEVAPGERNGVESLVMPVMQNAASLDVPLVVNASWGASWAAAKVA